MINAANMNIPLAGMSVVDATGAAESINAAQREISRAASFSDVLSSAQAVENKAAATTADMEIARAEAEGRFSRAMVNPQPSTGSPDMTGAGSQELLKDLANGTAGIMDRANMAMKNAEDAQRLRKEQEQKRYEAKVREACRGFETMFLSMMYRQMRATVPDNTLFGKSNSQKIWQSMLDDSMMEEVSKAGGVGLADMIYKQLTLRKQI
ncbi:MAG: rod-binding protein [Selenomonadaceae bacterium]|nr:rod-binding protein [Selenomonadaceae bacterium]